jgi:hypothetical protein
MDTDTDEEQELGEDQWWKTPPTRASKNTTETEN